MPTICFFRGIKIFINWDDHNPPHFHAVYGDDEMSVLIESAEPMAGDLPSRQKKMVLAWAVLRRDELLDDWALAEKNQALFSIEPLR
jgi:hypothetical protein